MKEAKELLDKYRSGKCNPKEKLLLQKWFHHLHEDELTELTETDLRIAKKEFRQKMIADISKSKLPTLWPRIISAAIIIFIISVGTLFYQDYIKNSDAKHAISEVQNDISPGGNIATLTLADGRKISLTDAKNGQLAEQSGIKISKTADGQLVYNISNSENSSQSLSYNTIETPPGGQYQVILPDGSKVWLNSASSLRYPVRFTGNERRVEISGEAYFEVAHNRKMPFRVINSNQTVEVLGTHFNIMAYPDEGSTNTTLIEGSVRIIKENKSKIITPGQQTRIKNGDIDVATVDVSQVTAWKDGYFMFKNEDIQSIMRQISRWYNLKVEYQGSFSEKVFGAKISRTRNVSEVLEILESTGSIHFKIIPGDAQGKERRIIVMP
ncbi:MAG: FecR domain-containing protein [Daejeonella sp.]|uniref:FecR family protein n=1 Tax=Daejeonella sp. TaxID=2805397 RepID=UPI002733176F|nr:FecR domain-containing protein [Daejeonella sp.]MDP3469677.1 FecR domain-containing protein [Daejeonella sp.]